MAMYFLLGRLNQEGQQAQSQDPQHVQRAVTNTETPGARVLTHYPVLGHHDAVILAEAEANANIAKLSVQLGQAAGMHFETLTGISPHFLETGGRRNGDEDAAGAEARPEDSRPEANPPRRLITGREPQPTGRSTNRERDASPWDELIAQALRGLEEWTAWSLDNGAEGNGTPQRVMATMAATTFREASQRPHGVARDEERRTCGILAVAAYTAAGEHFQASRTLAELWDTMGFQPRSRQERWVLYPWTGIDRNGTGNTGMKNDDSGWGAMLERLARALALDHGRDRQSPAKVAQGTGRTA